MEKNNTSTLPKQLHQCWDFAHNSWTNRGISPVYSPSSFPQQAQYEVQHNTNTLLMTFQTWEHEFFFLLMSLWEPRYGKYLKINPLLKSNPLFYTNKDVEKGV